MRSLKDYYRRAIYDKIDRRLSKKIYKYNNQSQIFTRDWNINKLNKILVN